MGADAKPGHDTGDDTGDDPADAAALAAYASDLADAMVAAIPAWIERLVVARIRAQRGEVTAAEQSSAIQAGVGAGAAAEPALRALLGTDIDRQTTTPLAVARRQVTFATAALAAAGVTPSPRDAFARRQAPEDTYDLTPAALADIDPALADPGLAWGAAKAHVHLARRRRQGLR